MTNPLATLQTYLGTPPLALVVAIVPAAVLSAVVLFLGRRNLRSWGLLSAGFLWGALVAAFLASTFNDLALLWVTSWGGGERAGDLTPVLFAPAIEETAKASALSLLLLLRRPVPVSTGALCGALVGIGFAMTENVQYFLIAMIAAGTTGLGQAVYTRALLGGFNHAVFTAFAGAAVAWAINADAPKRRRFGAVALGLGLAIAQHAVWNALASREISEILCNPEAAGGPCRGTPSLFRLLVIAPLVEIAFIAPGVVLLRAFVKRVSANPIAA